MRVKGDGLNQEQIEVAVIVHAKCIIIHSGETDLELIYQTINRRKSDANSQGFPCGNSQHSTQTDGRRTCRRITVLLWDGFRNRTFKVTEGCLISTFNGLV